MNRTELREILGCKIRDGLDDPPADTQILEAVLEKLRYRVDVNAPDESGWSRESITRLFSITADVLKVDGEYIPRIMEDVEEAQRDFMDVEVSVTLCLSNTALQAHGEVILDAVENRKIEQQRQQQFNANIRLWTKEVQDLEAMKSELKEGAYESRKSALERRKPVLEKS